MNVVLLIVLTLIGVSIVWAVTTALVGRLAGATALKVTFALGPSVRIARFGLTEVRLGLPISGGVRFLDASALDEEVEEIADPLEERRLLEELPFVARLSINLVGWLPIFLCAGIILGWSDAASELGQGFGQILRFFRDPAYPKMAMASLQTELSADRWMVAAAVVAMKVLAVGLLPLPTLSGGEVLRTIASALMRRPVRWPDLLVSISFGFCLLALVYFVEKIWKVLIGIQ